MVPPRIRVRVNTHTNHLNPPSNERVFLWVVGEIELPHYVTATKQINITSIIYI